ncbi:MAG TPA: hypothetical protein VGN83_10855 [Falsiroseomonas sp.]|jgi:hypothetical protein|nr:hypothetical protein [Falsiroseomonas sp.]
MTDWTLCRWHGPPAVLEAALRDLGWHGPKADGEEEPTATADPRIGGFIPSSGEPPCVIDGIAYAALVSRGPLPAPDGLADTPAELSISLLGSF